MGRPVNLNGGLYMSTAVDSMFYLLREKPWFDLGTGTEIATSSADALLLAGLDWDVVSRPVTVDGVALSTHKANVRTSDKEILGIVSDKYAVVQNKDAFAFADIFIGGAIVYEMAGSFRNGNVVWLLVRMLHTKILDDDVIQYICITNCHDGCGQTTACCMPIRTASNSALNLALTTAKRCWPIHVGDLEHKISNAKHTLELATTYTTELKHVANRLVKMPFTAKDQADFINQLFPLPSRAEELNDSRKKKNAETQRTFFDIAYMQPDINRFYGTRWGAINAVADMAYHGRPMRNAKNYRENQWEKSIVGNRLLDSAMGLLLR